MSIVEKDSTGAVTDERLFIWAGLSILQERDGNNTITKNHFANGFENLSSGTQYYYTKDHLGSIREVTDSSGTLVASYDYTPYGTRTLTSGTDISDFGYTGHFTHAKSGLLLAPYRAYDPQLGRWLSRDPIAENGGINLYAYVLNDPINLLDPNGLWGVGLYRSDRNQYIFLGQGAADFSITLDGFMDIAHGSQAAIDGMIPVWDPFADGFNSYDKCDENLQVSKALGTVSTLALSGYMLAPQGALLGSSTQVTQWGYGGSTWVITGGSSLRNYIMSGSILRYGLATARTTTVPKSALQMAPLEAKAAQYGVEHLSQWVKHVIGQRVFIP